MASILESVRPTVDSTIKNLSETKFIVDPIAGRDLSRVTSIISSAYKRHGGIIEMALYQAISAHNAIDAYSRVRFYVNRNASSYVESHNIKTKEGFESCALFMWATDPMLPQALELMTAWGFAFKTVAFNWVKLNKGGGARRVKDDPFFTGLGYWTRANPELCLLGTRGKPKRQSKAVRRLVVSERGEHSRKPDEIYDRIQHLVDGPYLELFARERRRKWDAIGDQLNDPVSRYLRRQPSRIRGEDDIAAPVVTAYAAE